MKHICASLIAVLLLVVPATAAAQCENGECSPGSRYGRSIKSDRAGNLSRRVDERTNRGQKPRPANKAKKAKKQKNADRPSFAVVQIGRRYRVVSQKKLAKLKEKYAKSKSKNSKNPKTFKVLKKGIAGRAIAWVALTEIEKKARISAKKEAQRAWKTRKSNSRSSTAPRRSG